MALVRCDGCGAVHESTLSVCPGCGRCPTCGDRRVSMRELAESANCPACGVPYCSGCGRCHTCGAIRFSEMEPHDHGVSEDERARAVEESFGLHKRGKGGCLILTIAAVSLGLGSWAVNRRPPNLALHQTPPAAAASGNINVTLGGPVR
jgi:hypothetical protein